MEKAEKKWPSAEYAAGVILITRWYTNIRLHLMARLIVMSLLGSGILLIGLYATFGRAPVYRYVLTDVTGKIVKMIPLSEPNHDDDYIVKWAIDAATRINTFDFVNYRGQFQEAKEWMTPQGWRDFEKGLKDAGILESVKGLRAVTTAVPTGPGVILKKANFLWPDGTYRYAWRVSFPMIITYRSAQINPETGQPRINNQTVNVDVTVMRMPEYLNAQGLGVRQLLVSGK